jgi:hypothetical protein
VPKKIVILFEALHKHLIGMERETSLPYRHTMPPKKGAAQQKKLEVFPPPVHGIYAVQSA